MKKPNKSPFVTDLFTRVALPVLGAVLLFGCVPTQNDGYYTSNIKRAEAGSYPKDKIVGDWVDIWEWENVYYKFYFRLSADGTGIRRDYIEWPAYVGGVQESKRKLTWSQIGGNLWRIDYDDYWEIVEGTRNSKNMKVEPGYVRYYDRRLLHSQKELWVVHQRNLANLNDRALIESKAAAARPRNRR